MGKNIKKRDSKYIITIIIAFAFSIIFSFYSIYQYYSLGTSAYDLGLHANILWNALHGRSFYTAMIGGNFLSEHFAPFEYIQLPIYYLYPSPLSIMIFQDVLLALAGIPLYKITQNIFGDKIKDNKIFSFIPLIIVLSYEISPFTASIYEFSFHNMAFLPFFMFMAIYAFLYNKKILNLFMIGFVISLHSNFVFIAIMIILFEIIYSRQNIEKNLMFSKIKHRYTIAGLFIFILFIMYIYLEFAAYSKGIISGTPHVSLEIHTGETGGVSRGIVGLIFTLFKDPVLFFSFVFRNYMMKLTYIALLFATTGFLTIFFPEALIMGFPYFLYAFTSSYGSYYAFGYQYAAMIYPVFFIGTVFAIDKIIRYNSDKKIKKLFLLYKKVEVKKVVKIITVLLIFGILLGLVYNPLIPYNNNAHDDITGYHNSGISNFLINESKYIPKNSTILVENTLMPYFSNYRFVYVTPFSSLPNYTQFNYIIYENNTYWANANGPSIQNISLQLEENHQVYLYKKYNNEVFIFKKY